MEGESPVLLMRSFWARSVRGLVLATGALAAAGLAALPNAAPVDTLVLWTIGSPYKGETPASVAPVMLQRSAASRGLRISVRALPASELAAALRDAIARNAGPDILAFDNMGLIKGTRTPLGVFVGIGQDPLVARDLVEVTGAFDEILGGRRGWTYLLASSPNHAAAKSLALRTPECRTVSIGVPHAQELAGLASRVAVAYLEGNSVAVESHADRDRLVTSRDDAEHANVAAARLCEVWGNDRVAFGRVDAAYEAERRIGHAAVTLVFRRSSTEWRLLVAARDPVTNTAFIKDMRSLMAVPMATARRSDGLPQPARLVSPPDDRFPEPGRGQRFGTFTWQSSASSEVIAEIAEFAYNDDARLFVGRRTGPDAVGHVSAGRLWVIRGEWSWRIWSVTRSGEIAFSDVRSFTH